MVNMSSTLASATRAATAAATTPSMTPEEFAARAAESNLPFILGLVTPFFVIAFIVVVLRTYVRMRIVKMMGADDWVMLGALGSSIIAMAIFSWQSQHGLGHHANTISAENFEKLRIGNLIYATLGAVLGMSFVKISMCLLLMRFVQHKAYIRSLWGIIIFLICFTIACWGTLVFWCHPVSAFWKVSLRRLPGNGCYPIVHFTNISIMNTAFNMFTDVLLATLPVHIIWTLQINRRQKLSLVFVLSLGYAAVALGVVKAIKQVELPKDNDAIFTQGVQTWGFVQLNVSIIAACGPALRPLFGFLADAVSSRNRTRGQGNTSGANARSGYFRQFDSSGKNTKNGSGLRSFADGTGEAVHMGPYPKSHNDDLERGGKSFVQVGARERESDGKSWIDADGDSGSEKEILPQGAKAMGMGGIVRTTAYMVKTDSLHDDEPRRER